MASSRASCPFPRMVTDSLNLDSLWCLRQASKDIRDKVDGDEKFKLIMDHAEPLLKAMMALGVAEYFTSVDLHAQLTTPNCAECENPAEFFSMLRCERVCTQCLRHNDRFFPVTLSIASECCALSPAQLARLPQVKTVPGTYTMKSLRLPMTELVYMIACDRSARRRSTAIRMQWISKSCQTGKH